MKFGGQPLWDVCRLVKAFAAEAQAH